MWFVRGAVAALVSPLGSALVLGGLAWCLLVLTKFDGHLIPPAGGGAGGEGDECQGLGSPPQAAIGTRKSRLMPTPRSLMRSRNWVR
jgi:hypothetical protein